MSLVLYHSDDTPGTSMALESGSQAASIHCQVACHNNTQADVSWSGKGCMGEVSAINLTTTMAVLQRFDCRSQSMLYKHLPVTYENT